MLDAVAAHGGAAAALLGGLLFSNSLRGDFVLDDTRAVQLNRDVVGDTPLSALLYNDFWGTPLSDQVSHKSFRPLTVLTFRLTHLFFPGGPGEHWAANPWAYHLGNVIAYMLCCALWWYLVRRTGLLSRVGALLAAVMFAAHPMHAENVSSLVGRADVLCFIFVIATVLCYLQAGAGGAVLRVAWYAAALVCFTLATASKESGLLGLALAAAFDLVLHGRVFWSPSSAPARRALGRTVLSAAVSIAALYASIAVRGADVSPTFIRIENPIAVDPDPATRALWYTHVHYWYLVLLVFPYWSCQDWGFDVIPRPDTGAPGAYLPPVVTYAVLFLLPLMLLRTRHRDAAVLVGALVVLPMLPASGVVRVATVLAERLLLIPTAGYALALGALYDVWCGEGERGALAPSSSPSPSPSPPSSAREARDDPPKRGGDGVRRRRGGGDPLSPPPPQGTGAASTARVDAGGSRVGSVLRPALLLYAAWLGGLAVIRSEKWETPTKLYTAGKAHCGRSAKGRQQLAAANWKTFQNGGGEDLELVRAAKEDLEAAIDIEPSYASAHVSLAKALVKLGDGEGYLRHLQVALRHAPDNANAHEMMGEYSLGQRDYENAQRHLGRSLRLRELRHELVNPQLRHNYGLAWGVIAENNPEQLEAAAAQIWQAIDAHPPHGDRCVWAKNLVQLALTMRRETDPQDLRHAYKALTVTTGACRGVLPPDVVRDHENIMAQLTVVPRAKP